MLCGLLRSADIFHAKVLELFMICHDPSPEFNTFWRLTKQRLKRKWGSTRTCSTVWAASRQMSGLTGTGSCAPVAIVEGGIYSHFNWQSFTTCAKWRRIWPIYNKTWSQELLWQRRVNGYTVPVHYLHGTLSYRGLCRHIRHFLQFALPKLRGTLRPFLCECWGH